MGGLERDLCRCAVKRGCASAGVTKLLVTVHRRLLWMRPVRSMQTGRPLCGGRLESECEAIDHASRLRAIAAGRGACKAYLVTFVPAPRHARSQMPNNRVKLRRARAGRLAGECNQSLNVIALQRCCRGKERQGVETALQPELAGGGEHCKRVVDAEIARHEPLFREGVAAVVQKLPVELRELLRGHSVCARNELRNGGASCGVICHPKRARIAQPALNNVPLTLNPACGGRPTRGVVSAWGGVMKGATSSVISIVEMSVA